jgi:hypothetical protein
VNTVKKRNAYRVLAGNPEGKSALVLPTYRCENNIVMLKQILEREDCFV